MRIAIEFSKVVASGNDFVLIEARNQKPIISNPGDLAKNICDRKFGIGADGLLIIEESQKADIKMRIFNPDGSEPDMCGNGVRCVALYSASNQKPVTRIQIRIETKAGMIEAVVNPAPSTKQCRSWAGRFGVNKAEVKVKMIEPKDIKLELPIKIGRRTIKVNFINTGVPHAVIFVEGLDRIDVVNIGRQIRFHKRFLPEGTNVDFVQVTNDNNIRLRTYERGVEDETFACGTGSVAAALISAIGNLRATTHRINVRTKSGEVLRVEFKRTNDNFKNIWFRGMARLIYAGVYYV